MFGKERHYTGFISRDNESRHPVSDDFGRSARQLDAERMLQEMDKVEAEVRDRERQYGEITNRVQQETARLRLDTDYLVSFGVAASHRHRYRSILQQTLENGEMTLHAAADLQ